MCCRCGVPPGVDAVCRFACHRLTPRWKSSTRYEQHSALRLRTCGANGDVGECSSPQPCRCLSLSGACVCWRCARPRVLRWAGARS
eukprot:3940544-Rhodomonas_salina.1